MSECSRFPIQGLFYVLHTVVDDFVLLREYFVVRRRSLPGSLSVQTTLPPLSLVRFDLVAGAGLNNV